MKNNPKNTFSKLIRLLSTNKYINKYTVTLLIFLIVIIFLADYSYLEKRKLKKQIEKTEKQIEFYNESINQNKEKQHALESDKKQIEKYAREQLNMKKNNEDIYYIEEK